MVDQKVKEEEWKQVSKKYKKRFYELSLWSIYPVIKYGRPNLNAAPRFSFL
jgi:hypothetical protein